jgi:hypothetical protein
MQNTKLILMAEHNELGKLGKLAVEFLQKNGYFSYKLDFSKASGYYCSKETI